MRLFLHQPGVSKAFISSPNSWLNTFTFHLRIKRGRMLDGRRGGIHVHSELGYCHFRKRVPERACGSTENDLEG